IVSLSYSVRHFIVYVCIIFFFCFFFFYLIFFSFFSFLYGGGVFLVWFGGVLVVGVFSFLMVFLVGGFNLLLLFFICVLQWH
ncbi:hypothetical protein LXA62_17805, partial [Erwinia amylovora]|nr:hypothetical protein [Erwinia amylovora]